jgi:pyruvate/2-oxoglutarate dehydrogenase complex dihydrolipoamide dehydrogenase (E3) component
VPAQRQAPGGHRDERGDRHAVGQGCAVLGSEGGEVMTMIQIAMLGKLTYTAMADAIFTHPLLAEGLNTLFRMFDT